MHNFTFGPLHGGLTQDRARRFAGRSVVFRLTENSTWQLTNVDELANMVNCTEVHVMYIMPK